MIRKLTLVLLLLVSLSFSADNSSRNPEPHANCCLCACHAKDETKCSKLCIRLQHGKKVVMEPEMNVCTKSCQRVKVKKVDAIVEAPITKDENNFCNPDYIPGKLETLEPSARCLAIPCDHLFNPARCVTTI